MDISFTYKRITYTFEADSLILDINSRFISVCYPINLPPEWYLIWGNHHSPLFYSEDLTPILGEYSSRSGDVFNYQAFIDTETKKIVESLVIKPGRKSFRYYEFKGFSSIRRADNTLAFF